MAHYFSTAAAVLTALLAVSAGAVSTSAADTNEFETATETEISVTSSDSTDLPQGTWITQGGKQYYLFADGTSATGEVEIDGILYLFGYSGALKTDWQTVDGKRFYYDPETGTPRFGWIEYFGKLYYVSETDGKLTGLQEIDGELYFFAEDGVLMTGDFTVEDTRCYGDPETGILTAGLQETPEGLLLTDETGTVLTGWQETESGTYYLDAETGLAQFGLLLLDGQYYCITQEDGLLRGNTVMNGTVWPFDEETGALAIGWYTIEDAQFYFDLETACTLSDCFAVIDGSTYCFGQDGAMITGWLTTTDGTYYFNEDGTMAASGLLTIDDSTYYFNENGRIVTGWLTLDGKEYYFKEDGSQAVSETLSLDGYDCTFDASGALTSKVVAKIALDVVSYKQFDSQWASVALGSSTIKSSGCLVTAMAMLHSYTTGTEITPVGMKNMLTFTSGGALASWAQITALGYTVETYDSTVTETTLKAVFNQLRNGKPVIMGCKSSSGGQHYVVITGYTGDGSSFTSSMFTINDPGSSKRSLLSEYLTEFYRLYKLIF
jgi:glucan-binding YG repeat protein